MTSTELAILGWDERVERILPLLEAHAGCRLVGVADRSGVALVRARAVTGAPCSSTPRRWCAGWTTTRC